MYVGLSVTYDLPCPGPTSEWMDRDPLEGGQDTLYIRALSLSAYGFRFSQVRLRLAIIHLTSHSRPKNVFERGICMLSEPTTCSLMLRILYAPITIKVSYRRTGEHGLLNSVEGRKTCSSSLQKTCRCDCGEKEIQTLGRT